MPAASSADRMAEIASGEIDRRAFSWSTIVESPNPAACARFVWDQFRRARAARHWAGVILINIFC